jgi:hypothetical protein
MAPHIAHKRARQVAARGVQNGASNGTRLPPTSTTIYLLPPSHSYYHYRLFLLPLSHHPPLLPSSIFLLTHQAGPSVQRAQNHYVQYGARRITHPTCFSAHLRQLASIPHTALLHHPLLHTLYSTPPILNNRSPLWAGWGPPGTRRQKYPHLPRQASSHHSSTSLFIPSIHLLYCTPQPSTLFRNRLYTTPFLYGHLRLHCLPTPLTPTYVHLRPPTYYVYVHFLFA